MRTIRLTSLVLATLASASTASAQDARAHFLRGQATLLGASPDFARWRTAYRSGSSVPKRRSMSAFARP